MNNLYSGNEDIFWYSLASFTFFFLEEPAHQWSWHYMYYDFCVFRDVRKNTCPYSFLQLSQNIPPVDGLIPRRTMYVIFLAHCLPLSRSFKNANCYYWERTYIQSDDHCFINDQWPQILCPFPSCLGEARRGRILKLKSRRPLLS